LAEAGEVAVAFDEPGDGQRAAEVDDLGPAADVAVESLRVRAQRRDAVAAASFWRRLTMNRTAKMTMRTAANPSRRCFAAMANLPGASVIGTEDTQNT
jgi:hypothetical protein